MRLWVAMVLIAGNIVAQNNNLPCIDQPRILAGYSLATPGQITIVWPTNVNRLYLDIWRRQFTNDARYWSSWTTHLFTTNGTGVTNAGQFVDTGVSDGIHYEYQIEAASVTNVCGTNAPYGNYAVQYISTGTHAPLQDDRGNLILLVESGIAGSIMSDLTNLVNDLVGDGYHLFQHYYPRGSVYLDPTWASTVVSIKTQITNDYNTNPSNRWSIMIVGHIPVPFSGDSSPGSHPNNIGAHPADWYYASGINPAFWTDTVVNDSTSDFTNNFNVPGDGKFDTNNAPDFPFARIGRVDFANMPVFGKTEAQLLSQYLQRDHSYRLKGFVPSGTMTWTTNVTPASQSTDAYEAIDTASSFAGVSDPVVQASWLDWATNSAQSTTFGICRSSGGYDVNHSLGYASNFANASGLFSVFNRSFGSYYGDWDSTYHSNAFLQAPLCANGYALTHAYLENQMPEDSTDMGEPVGQTMFTMAGNNYATFAARYLQSLYIFGGTTNATTFAVRNYESLMGDPTLVLRVAAPPTNVQVRTSGPSGNNRVVYWLGPLGESGVVGYHVYRAPPTNLNQWVRLTSVPQGAPFIDSTAAGSNYTYWVRTVKLQSSVNRSYYVASEASFSSGLTGTSYFVAKTGSDSNPGSDSQPFLTVQKGLTSAHAGDSVTVSSGTYSEDPSTANNGPVILDGQGVATIRSLLVLNPSYEVINCTFSGRSSGYEIFVEKGAHYGFFSNNIIDGLYNTSIFEGMKWDNPIPGTETPYGGNVASGWMVVSNLFIHNSGTVCVQAYGDTNIFWGNTMQDGDQVDQWHVWGRNSLISHNYATNNFKPGSVNGNHPDFYQIGGENGAGASNIVLECNTCINLQGDSQLFTLEGHDCVNDTDIVFRNNQFIYVGCKGTSSMQRTRVYNNLFVDCINSNSTDLVLVFTTETNGVTYTNFQASSAHGGQCFNNIFLRCAATNGGQFAAYKFETFLTNIASDFNYRAGTNYSAMAIDPGRHPVGDPCNCWSFQTWWENHGLNGGSPSMNNESAHDYRVGTNSILYAVGTNLFNQFTTDALGNARPASGNWTIGPFEAATVVNPTPPPPPPGNFATLRANIIRVGTLIVK